jgi:hypothetical protein
VTCTAISLAGVRCDRRVGRSDRAQRYQLCARHSRSPLLRFVQSMRRYDYLMQPDGDSHETQYERVIDLLIEQCAAFGPAIVADVRALAAAVPKQGSDLDYLNAVLAVVLPRLQAHADARTAEVARQKVEVDAMIAANERRIAEDFKWRDVLTQFDPTITH